MQSSNQEQRLLQQHDSQDDSQTESSQNQDDGFSQPQHQMPVLSQSVDMHPVSAVE